MTFANPPPKLILGVSRFACSRLTARSFPSLSLSLSLFRGIKPRRFRYDRRFIFTYKFYPLEIETWTKGSGTKRKRIPREILSNRFSVEEDRFEIVDLFGSAEVTEITILLPLAEEVDRVA